MPGKRQVSRRNDDAWHMKWHHMLCTMCFLSPLHISVTVTTEAVHLPIPTVMMPHLWPCVSGHQRGHLASMEPSPLGHRVSHAGSWNYHLTTLASWITCLPIGTIPSSLPSPSRAEMDWSLRWVNIWDCACVSKHPKDSAGVLENHQASWENSHPPEEGTQSPLKGGTIVSRARPSNCPSKGSPRTDPPEP
jgi:hypothetical protein